MLVSESQGSEDEEIERDETRNGAPDVMRARMHTVYRDEVSHLAGALLSM